MPIDNLNYFITITYSDDNAPKGNRKEQFDTTNQKVISLLQDACTGYLVPEFTKKNRIHYHGIITFHNKFLFYKKIVPILKQTTGEQLYVKPCRSGYHVSKYCHKDVYETQIDVESVLPLYFEKRPPTKEEKKQLRIKQKQQERINKALDDILDLIT